MDDILNIYGLTNISAHAMMGLNLSSFQFPGGISWHRSFATGHKMGLGEPEVTMEVAVVQAQLLKKVGEFSKLCASLEDYMNPDTTASETPTVLGFTAATFAM